ncbi:hypothetical protein QFZ34_001336 [Phyllobacterium ifriqiyense]|uniref:Uncharacterized protein n=1 Tax=Phyllobacterium ifriqiyense TaxID=314238 RepID=A0ABU0S600_9HYPH|nr:hypothetical protein [Phyllobacterium ifriqiyense]MDQ0996159.1 hypothetical protein [Phyllobacterium ifriqiyense]
MTAGQALVIPATTSSLKFAARRFGDTVRIKMIKISPETKEGATLPAMNG